MARARIISTRKVAQRIATQALDLLRSLISKAVTCVFLVCAYTVSAMNLPALQRTHMWREIRWLHRRFVLLMSEGYNFEEFYRTQHGVRGSDVSDRTSDLGHMSTRQLLSVAHDLASAAAGVVAMRELIVRAEKKAALRVEASGTVAVTYKPISHDPNIHRQWRDAIETAFTQDQGAPRRAIPLPPKLQARPKKGLFVEPGWVASQPLLAEDNAAFELSIPQIVSYRASTRH